MSAGWKKKSTFWNLPGSSRRSVRTNSNTEVLCPGLSDTWISPSVEPMVALSLKARFTPPTGRPMLSITRRNSSGGTTVRM